MASDGLKPSFNGYLKMFLHDSDPDQLIDRATTDGEWATKRWQILKKPRRFSVRFHFIDIDGHKRYHEVVDFKSKGKDKELCAVIYQLGSKLVDNLKDEGVEIDVVNSYAVIRA